MQSSLFKFMKRRERESSAGKKRQLAVEGECEVPVKKKRKGEGAAHERLKQFTRRGHADSPAATSSSEEGVWSATEASLEGSLQSTPPRSSSDASLSSLSSAVAQSPSANQSKQSTPQSPSTNQSKQSTPQSPSTNQSKQSTPQSSSTTQTKQSTPQSSSTTRTKQYTPQSSSTTLSKQHTPQSPRPGLPQSPLTPLLSGKQYTPLEQQFIALKARHPDAVLFVECGYKYRFFGEDAEVAARVLKIGCFPDHHFKTASIPVHRLHIHLRRMVAAGYKVGVVKQMETAALKAASENRSKPFTRELAGLYTRATLIGPDVEGVSGGGCEGVSGGACEEDREGLYLMCLCEATGGKSRGRETTIGFLAVQPTTGNMLYDEVTDDCASFSELETRFSHVQPAELLYPADVSRALDGTLSEWATHKATAGVRLEKLPEEWFDYHKAHTTVTNFYGSSGTLSDDHTPSDHTPCSSGASEGSSEELAAMADALQVVINLPPTALCALGALIKHLEPFKLQRVLRLTSNLKPFAAGTHCMRLTSKTLQNLEVFANQTNKTVKGSLFWVLDHTLTAFGRRQLTSWTSHPLRDLTALRGRQEAVRELAACESPSLSLLVGVLSKLPDLEKMLCSAYHKKCSPAQFYSMVKALVRVQREVESFSEMALNELHSDLVLQTIKQVPSLLRGCQQFLDALCQQAAREGAYRDLFAKPDMFPSVDREKKAIAELMQKLKEHLKELRKVMRNPSLEYTAVNNVQYLVEVKNTEVNRIPTSWTRIGGTKRVSRFHSPYVVEATKQLAQHSDQLVLNAKAAWNKLLDDFSAHYGSCKRCVELLATTDCLLSLAKVANTPGYVCPTLVEEPLIDICEGRHPVIDLLLGEGEQYVPNDTHIKASDLSAMIITGPNMGGKSSYIKQVALLCVMAQIGSFVPAASATLGLLDAIYTRMGASDRLCSGKSTFMQELMETAEILSLATPSSLVILDELGRGTSTHDGTAIAYATLTHFLTEVKCLTLFVTHYPLIGDLQKCFPSAVANYHMAYLQVEDSSDDYDKVVFLYQLQPGVAGGSYGLNVAALAGLQVDILRVARHKARQMEESTVQRWNASSPLLLCGGCGSEAIAAAAFSRVLKMVGVDYQEDDLHLTLHDILQV